MVFRYLENENYRKVLQDIFEIRRLKNPSYSLRAYARDLGLSPEMLSLVTRNKKGLSHSSAEKVAIALNFSAEDREYFCTLVEEEHGRSEISRRVARAKLQSRWAQNIHHIELDSFRLISDWYHFAILELCNLSSFRSDAEWVAMKLGLELNVIKEAIARLTRLKVMSIDQEGRWHALGPFVAGPDGIASDAIKNFQRQILARSIESIDTSSIEDRDISSVIMAFDSRHMSEAKRLIRDFRRSFEKKLPKESELDSLHCLSIQFFRLDNLG